MSIGIHAVFPPLLLVKISIGLLNLYLPLFNYLLAACCQKSWLYHHFFDWLWRWFHQIHFEFLNKGQCLEKFQFLHMGWNFKESCFGKTQAITSNLHHILSRFDSSISWNVKFQERWLEGQKWFVKKKNHYIYQVWHHSFISLLKIIQLFYKKLYLTVMEFKKRVT